MGRGPVVWCLAGVVVLRVYLVCGSLLLVQPCGFVAVVAGCVVAAPVPACARIVLLLFERTPFHAVL